MKSQTKHRSTKIVLIIILLLLLVGFFFFHHFQTQQNNDLAQSQQLDYQLNKLSTKDASSLLITYMHLKYKKNKAWHAVYEKAINGQVSVKRYPHYSFGQYTVRPQGSGSVYVVDSKAAFSISHPQEKSQAVIEFGDNHHALGSTKLKTVYVTVVQNPQLRHQYQQIKQGIDLSTGSQGSDSAAPASTDQTPAKKPARSGNLWNAKKDQELADFMDSWGQTMDQDYQRYDGQTPLRTSVGLVYPDALPKEQSGEDASTAGALGWAPTGRGSYQYNVVAIYNHDGTEPPMPNRITYFFCFDSDGDPIVFVDQSRDGEPRYTETQNQKLLAGFKKIAEE